MTLNVNLYMARRGKSISQMQLNQCTNSTFTSTFGTVIQSENVEVYAPPPPPPPFSLCTQDVVYNVAESILTEYFIWLQIVNLANRQTGKTCVSKHISAPVCCVFGLACLGHTKNTTKKTCSIENIEYFVWSCCIKQFTMYYQGCTYKCCHGYQMQRWAFDKMLPRRHLSESNRWKKSMNKMVTGLQCIYIIQCLSKEQYTYICSHRFRIHLFDTRNL